MRGIAIAATGILLTAACSYESAQFSETGEGSPSVVATASPTATADPEPTPTTTPTVEPTPATTVEPTPASAFADTDRCTNEEHGWTVTFPESWWTNTAFTHSSDEDVPACWMFSADEFDATDARNPNQPASGAEVHLQLVPPPGIVGVSGEIASEDDVAVDGFEARRVEWRGTESDTTMGEDDRLLQYVVELPDDVEFMAFADSTRTSDYDHAVEVLDGMMERIELSAP